MTRYMMATAARHVTGDLSRSIPDLACIDGEDGDAYIGQWVAGFGFFNVRFPKASTRELTDAERAYYRAKVVDLAGSVTPIDLGPEAA
ncbi:hypothetical protein [Catenuloplanes indicus]|uniref:Uncharacterized protein n=1 Tax=Catenuloplanes indicus TaxID=137267 RepID=A0AAE3W8Q5_9ACTN|nr:hypothetical protein [Catenuloplanes indicus]MDQ0371561.1 hypothetical protein [Catenuloplanes indicus]